MTNPSHNQIHHVTTFHDLISTPMRGEVNAICWERELKGDFAEIVEKIVLDENIRPIEEEELLTLQLSEQGQLAREMILNDLKLLTEHGEQPVLNVIRNYDSDDVNTFFATDVYSFHVDRSPIPTFTFLCTYYGEPSDIVPNTQCTPKMLIPEIRSELRKLHDGADEDFESFLTEHFFDLHYQPHPDARIISLGTGNLWRLAVDHPQSEVPPCVHRAPKEKPGQSRLLLIC